MRSMIMAAALISTHSCGFGCRRRGRADCNGTSRGHENTVSRDMRTQENSLNDVVQLMAKGKIHEAGSTAHKEMAIGQAHGFGRYMPPEFREMGFCVSQGCRRFCPDRFGHPRAARCAGMGKTG